MIKNDIFLPDEMEKDREILEKTLKKIIFMETERINDVEGLPVQQVNLEGIHTFLKMRIIQKMRTEFHYLCLLK